MMRLIHYTVKLPFLLVLVGIISVAYADVEMSPVVKTKSGPIRGRLLHLQINSTEPASDVYAFSGIPFAEPPVGARRFQKPTPVKPWSDDNILDATHESKPCLQSKFSNPPAITGSEDCLYLNIWVPKHALDEMMNGTLQDRLATYIYIHGGSYLTGSAAEYNNSLLASLHNIIAVSIQYRLGSLGFAYLGNEDIPGNMGLWDQSAAIKWISENVEFFGGNNSEITIGGQSAGAASTTFHLLSPYSRKYFQRAIVQSGSASAPWTARTKDQAALTTNFVFQQVASRFCKELSLQSSPNDKTRCLKTAASSILPFVDMTPATAGFGIPFAPVIDGDFVPRDPTSMLKDGDFAKVPLLIGATKDEGAYFLAETPSMPAQINDPNLNITEYREIVEYVLKFYLGGVEPTNDTLRNSIELQYWPERSLSGKPKSDDIVNAISSMMTDSALLCPTYEWADYFSKYSDVYSYFFNHRRSYSPLPEWMGVTHGDDLPFVFGEPLIGDDAKFSDKDREISLNMLTYWTNFVKYSNPNGVDLGMGVNSTLVTWPKRVGKTCQDQSLEIKNKQVEHVEDSVLCGIKTGNCLYWNDLYPKLMQIVQDAVRPKLRS